MVMYYIALVAPEPIYSKVTEWKIYMRDHFGCVAALRSPPHITLVPPFWMKGDLQETLETQLDQFSSGFRSFEIELKDFDSFAPRAIFVAIKDHTVLKNLHRLLNEHLIGSRSFGIKPEERQFHPHMTIAMRDLQKRDFKKAWEYFSRKNYEANWKVQGLSLLRHDQKKWDVVHTSQFSD